MDSIPKIIHYCWFGNKKLPNQYVKYINNWYKKCSDYKIIKWNEENFNINSYEYAKEAYQKGKMAFVSDVARIYALYNYGGIYLDTDVEINKRFDKLLKLNKTILGWESNENDDFKTLGTGCMIFPPKSKICEEMLNYYKNTSFILKDGSLNLKSNTYLLWELINKKYGDCFQSNKYFENDDIIIFPLSYFTAFNYELNRVEKDENTYCVHHFAASWFSPVKKIKRYIKVKLRKCHDIYNYIKRRKK
ncbi:MAG: glycosyltransferase family 32 protein [Clostridia bacterium]